MSNYINLTTEQTQISVDNPLLTVHMSLQQYEEMVNCVEQVKRNRERVNRSYHEKKAQARSNEAKIRRSTLIPVQPYNAIIKHEDGLAEDYKPQMPQNEMSAGYRPLQLIIQR